MSGAYNYHLAKKLKYNLPIVINALRHPDRILNLFGVLLYNNRCLPRKTPFGPYMLDIEPTINCNAKCIMCHAEKLRKKKRIRTMSFEDFRTIIDKMPTLIRLMIQGMGEPLMCPDFFAMVDYAVRKDIAVLSTFNAHFCTPTNSRRIVDSGMLRLHISIDGATKETYERIRIGADWETTIAGIRNLVRARGKSSRPGIDLNMVGMKENIKELPQMVQLACDLGVDSLTFETDISYWGKGEFRLRMSEQSVFIDQRLLVDMVNSAKSIAQKNRFDFIFTRRHSYNKENPCLWSFRSGAVSTDGYYVPCCILFDPDIVNFGNVLTTDFHDIWNGEQIQRFRTRIGRMNIPECCQDCYSRSVLTT